ncbi:alpha/beta fold hydrolase [Nocardia sp. NPDC006044]|uniref:alpha/beta fold hydrolase n=1 Tax=Nocardia sp. NPDC006044 TaxID=3364306 RepID=UPI0036AD4592
MRSDTLKVPGATLYYEVRGNGPVLLLLPGSGGDAAVFDPIADTLAAHFTVVTLDPRGYSRSIIDSEEPGHRLMAAQRDNAVRFDEQVDGLIATQRHDTVRSTEPDDELITAQRDDTDRSTGRGGRLIATRRDNGFRSAEQVNLVIAPRRDDTGQSTDRPADELNVGRRDATAGSAQQDDGLIAAQREDAYRLLETLTPAGEDAYVFGGSGGAVVALDLLTYHPERLRLVVAHEPPCFAVLPDAAEQKAFIDEVYLLFRTEGIAAAGARFLQGIGGTMKPMPNPADLPPRAAEMIQRLHDNADLMMAHELRPITSYLPDEPTLATHTDRLILAAGKETRGHLPHRPAATLAEHLNLPLTEFPGGHSGFTDAPTEFATQLLNLLLATRVQ